MLDFATAASGQTGFGSSVGCLRPQHLEQTARSTPPGLWAISHALEATGQNVIRPRGRLYGGAERIFLATTTTATILGIPFAAQFQLA
jgi:hypothetical protein